MIYAVLLLLVSEIIISIYNHVKNALVVRGGEQERYAKISNPNLRVVTRPVQMVRYTAQARVIASSLEIVL